ncbi:cytochrome P450 [Daedaleopsis nitida]|nr:cytochrome P450 [Daedaleopsis nitida]
MEDPKTVLSACVVVWLAIYLVRWWTDPLNRIPTLGGSSAPILSYLSALNFMRNGKELIHEGYHKFYNTTYKVATLDSWLVIVSGPKMIDDVRRRPDNELSFEEGVQDTIQTKYTLGRETSEDPYHVDIIREKLTRTLPAVLPDVIDELKVAVQEHIPTADDSWTTLPVMKTMQEIVARASNRAFVGFPICRNQSFLDLAIAFAITVMKDRYVINAFPNLLKPIVGRLISKTKKSVTEALKYLQPIIDERRENMKTLGDDWNDKPNDMLQWLMDESANRGQKGGDYGVAQRILLINFAAIHTSSTTITHVIFDLAARPEYAQPLRDEVEQIIAVDGWTKVAMAKMWKLDSFLKECIRFNNISLTSLTRKAMKDLTLVDGTFIPKGTLVVAAAGPTHYDEAYYPDPSVFDGFRFARLREDAGEGTKHQFVNTSTEYIAFGHGKHACPGRFFAANELKAMLAYIVLNYDLKIADGGERPKNIHYGPNVIPSFTGEVSFRKRY